MIGPSYQLEDRRAAVQRSVNWFVSRIEAAEDKQMILRSAPGLLAWIEESTFHGLYAAGGRVFFVLNNGLYELDTETRGYLLKGMLLDGSGPVSMVHGETQLVLVRGEHGWVYNLATDTLTKITDPEFLGSQTVSHLDGYFIFAEPGTSRFYLSAIDDGSDFDALDFSSADTQPDAIITHTVFKRELFLFGEYSTEVWVNVGGADFPLVRSNVTQIDIGCVGPQAVVKTTDSLLFVGRSRAGRGYVYILDGYIPRRVSNRAVEEALAGSSDLSGCVGWTYADAGSEFVGFTAPGLETSWVYDLSTQQWHERAEWIDDAWAPLNISHVVFANGKYLCLYVSSAGRGVEEGRLGQIDTGTYSYGTGLPMMRERTWPHMTNPRAEPITYAGLEMLCTTGHGGRVTLEISNDGGLTWGAPLARSLGATGRYMERVRWLGLGAARDRVFRVRCSDDVPLNVYRATVDAA